MDYENVIPQLSELLQRIGAKLLEMQATVTPEEKTGPEDLVSEADRYAERTLRKELPKLVDADFNGEESSWHPWFEDARCWVVDPIDGTKPYLEGKDGWAISVGLCEGPRPVLGAIYFPSTKKLFTAIRGRGAFRNGELIKVAKSQRRAVISDRNAELKRPLEENGWKVSFRYASTEMLSLVAEGKSDAYVSTPENGPHLWDVAAGEVIITEAGGTCTDIFGKQLLYNVADPKVHGLCFANEVHGNLVKLLSPGR